MKEWGKSVFIVEEEKIGGVEVEIMRWVKRYKNFDDEMKEKDSVEVRGWYRVKGKFFVFFLIRRV